MLELRGTGVIERLLDEGALGTVMPDGEITAELLHDAAQAAGAAEVLLENDFHAQCIEVGHSATRLALSALLQAQGYGRATPIRQ